MARAFAKRLEADLVVLDKRRPRANEAEVMNIIGQVNGRNVLLVDDMIDTGGTFANAVRALKAAGAEAVYGACTHPVFSGLAVPNIAGSGVSRISVTDTIPLRKAMEDTGLIDVQSVASLFAEALKRTHLHQSISSLFDVDKDK
jgi:ribose-phosphate pyrophosphokinase